MKMNLEPFWVAALRPVTFQKRQCPEAMPPKQKNLTS